MSDQPELLQVFLDWLREATPQVALTALGHIQQARPELWALVEDALRAERENGVIDMRGTPLAPDSIFRSFRTLERNSDRARARALTEPLPYFVHPETRAQMERDMAASRWAVPPALATPSAASPATEALVAEAWEQLVNGDWVRPSRMGWSAARVWDGDDDPYWSWVAVGRRGVALTSEAARNAADAALRAAGWELQ